MKPSRAPASFQAKATLASFAVLTMTAAPLLADTYTFNNTGTPETWTTTATWTDTTNPSTNGGLAFPNSAGDVADVEANITATNTLTLGTSVITLGTLNVGDSNASNTYTIAAGTGGSFIFNNVSTANSTSGDSQINQIATSAGDTISAPIAIDGNGALDVSNAAATATLTLSGNITSNLTTGTQALNVNSAGAVTINGVLSDNSGAATNAGGFLSLTKSGAGTLTLGTANTYTGATTITGGTVSISNATSFGAATSTAAINLGDTAGAVNTAITLGANVTLARAITVQGGNTGTATLGGFQNNSSGGAYTGAIVLGSNGVGHNLILTGDSGNTIYTTTQYSGKITDPANLTGTAGTVIINGGGVRLGGTYNGTAGSGIPGSTFTGGVTLNSGGLEISDAGGSGTFGTGTLTLNGGLINQDYTTTIIPNATVVGGNFTSGGNNGGTTFTGSTFTLKGNYTITLSGINTTINGVISDGGNGYRLSASGGETLNVNDTANTYSGGISASGSATIAVAADGSLGTAPTTATANFINLNGGTLYTGASFTLNANRGIGIGATTGTTAATGTLNISGSTVTVTYNGSIASAGTTGATTFVKAGTGTLVLGGTSNSYTGPTSITGGLLVISQDANLPTAPAAATAGSINLNGGGIEANASFTLNANRGISIGAATGTTAATGIFDVASGQTLTYTGLIASAGTTGLTNLTFQDSGTLILSGANTYTGGIVISGGGTLNVTDLLNGGVASSLGTSSNAASNLVIGNLGNFQYGGANTSSDRLFTVGAGNSGAPNTSTLSSSGMGAINLTNTGTLALGNANTATLVLSGTNTGANTLSAVLANTTAGAVASTAGNYYNTYIPISTSTANIVVGDKITGTGIPAGTYVTSIGSNYVYISQSPTANVPSGSTVNFSANGVTGLIKSGTGFWAVTAANTFTGPVSVTGGTLSTSNLANGGSASGLGESSNAASNLVLSGGTTLQYTGAATSTDRLFTLGTSNSGAANSVTLDASGSGAVNFTNTGTVALGNSNTSTLILTGTSTDPGNTLATVLANTTSTLQSKTTDSASSGSTTLTVSITGLAVGDKVTGSAAIPAGDYITAVGSSTVTLSAATTGAVSNASLAFTPGTTGLTKSGVGTWTLTGANTFTGPTNVGAGILNAGATSTLATTSGITVNNGGTLLLSAASALGAVTPGTTTGVPNVSLGGGTGLARTGTGSAGSGNMVGIGILTLTASSSLDFGTTGVGTININSFMPTGNILTVLNDSSASGAAGVDGTNDRLIFNQDLQAAGYLNDIVFGPSGTAASEIALGNGEFEIEPIAVPEPATWAGGLLMLMAAGGHYLRRRYRTVS